MKLGIDVSTLIEEQLAGAKYFDNGKEINPLECFAKQNVSLIRLRVWNNPYSEEGKPYLGGTNDLEQTKRIIQATRQYGYSYIIDFHYSDFWVDPGKQTLPKVWKDLSYDELLVAVYEYTRDALLELKALDVDIPYVQVGNEITNGFLWPHGKLFDTPKDKEKAFEDFINLIKSGIRGVKEALPDTKIIIHLEGSNKIALYEEYFTFLHSYNVEYDIIGMSYYPYWHGTMDEVFQNVANCRKLFHKNVMISELGYGFTLEDYLLNNNGVNQMKINPETLEAALPYEISKEGQALFIEDFLNRATKENLEAVIYWEPLWIPGDDICWASKEGQAYIKEEGKSTRNEWSNQCLFDYTGNKLPGFDKFKL